VQRCGPLQRLVVRTEHLGGKREGRLRVSELTDVAQRDPQHQVCLGVLHGHPLGGEEPCRVPEGTDGSVGSRRLQEGGPEVERQGGILDRVPVPVVTIALPLQLVDHLGEVAGQLMHPEPVVGRRECGRCASSWQGSATCCARTTASASR
jgi:hypothetical protein